jgi:hypothetical protein
MPHLLGFPNISRNKDSRSVFELQFESIGDCLSGFRKHVVAINEAKFSRSAAIIVGILENRGYWDLGVFFVTQNSITLPTSQFTE